MMKRILPIVPSAVIGGASVWFFMQSDSEVSQTAADSAREIKAHSRAADDPGPRDMAEPLATRRGETVGLASRKKPRRVRMATWS